MRFPLFIALAGALAMAGCSSDEQAQVGTNTTAPAGSGAAVPNAGPGALSPQQANDAIRSAGDRVFFGFDSSELTAEGQSTLQAQASILQRAQGAAITIEGHADERGTREYNFALGERRATAAKNYLVALGVPAQRIRTVSFGKERPVDPGSNETAFSRNRRAVTVVGGQGS